VQHLGGRAEVCGCIEPAVTMMELVDTNETMPVKIDIPAHGEVSLQLLEPDDVSCWKAPSGRRRREVNGKQIIVSDR
jgi:hypothetical protein